METPKDILDKITDIYLDIDNATTPAPLRIPEVDYLPNPAALPITRNNNSKISLARAEEIRNKYRTRERDFKNIKQIAINHKVSYSVIQNIISNKSHCIDKADLKGYQLRERNESIEKAARIAERHQKKKYYYPHGTGKPPGPKPKPNTPEYFWGQTDRARQEPINPELCWPWWRTGRNPRIKWAGQQASPCRIAAALEGLIPHTAISNPTIPGEVAYNIHHSCPQNINGLDIMCCNPKHFKIITYPIPSRLRKSLNTNEIYNLREDYLNKLSIEDCMAKYNISRTMAEYVLLLKTKI